MRRHTPIVAALGIPALLFFAAPPPNAIGAWDPIEVDFADRARRVAEHLLGAPARGGALPTLAELGRPDGAHAIAALAMRLFGARLWPARVAMAACALAAVAATYAFVARLVDRRAGAYAAIATATTPLVFAQAHAAIGEAPTFAATAMAFGALAVLAFAPPRGGRAIAWAATAIAGLALGFACRGALIGIAAPSLSVGLAWALARRSGEPRARAIAGAASLAIGAGACALGAWGIAHAADGEVSRLAGVMMHAPARAPSFDRVLAQLGHALVPWSALAPFAVARLAGSPPRAGRRASSLRVAIVIALALTYGAHAALANVADAIPFSAPWLVGAACAIALRDVERGARPSIAVAAGTIALVVVLGHDLRAIPEKAFEAYGVVAPFPPALRAQVEAWWAIALAPFAIATWLAWSVRGDDANPREDLRARWARRLARARAAADGRLAFAWGAIVVGAATAAAAVAIGRAAHASWALEMARPLRLVATNLWWAIALAPIAAIVAAHALVDALRGAIARAPSWRLHPAMLVVVGGIATAAVLCGSVYPALAARLSPGEALASLARLRAPDEPVALLGVSPRAAALSTGAEPTVLRDAAAAIAWLDDAPGPRRWLVTSEDELPRLDALHRARAHANLAVLDARSDRALLVASALAPGEISVNPLDAVLPAGEPAPRHRLDVDLGGKVTLLGWDLVDARGRALDAIAPGREARLRTWWRVAASPGAWTMFVHLDGHGRRFNGDHAPTEGRYPMTLWAPGDVVVDDHAILLTPNFTPGVYRLYVGLFAGGDEGRMKVARGPSDGDDRVDVGAVRVE